MLKLEILNKLKNSNDYNSILKLCKEMYLKNEGSDSALLFLAYYHFAEAKLINICPKVEIKIIIEEAKLLDNPILLESLYQLINIDHSENQGPKLKITLKGKEEILYKTILEAPTSKIDLIDAIYPDSRDIIQSEKRLKALLSRIRKKLPGQIILNTDHKYQIVK
jgi:hypothetical protein